MEKVTLQELEAYANEHFPDNFARLPSPDCFTFQPGEDGQPRLLVGEIVEHNVTYMAFATVDLKDGSVTYTSDPDVDFDGRNVRLYEPFSWLHPRIGHFLLSAHQMHVFIQYCFMVAGHSVAFDASDKINFDLVCADIVAAQNLKKSLLGIKDVSDKSAAWENTDVQRQLQEAKAEAEEWKQKYFSLLAKTSIPGESSSGSGSEHA